MHARTALASLFVLGLLVFVPRAGRATSAVQAGPVEVVSRLIWFDRGGRRLGVVDSPANERGLELSPDGRRATVTMLTAERRTRDIWMIDVSSGSRSRFTDDPGDKLFSIWSPDGRRIVYDRDAGDGTGARDLYEKPAGGTGEAAVLLADGRPKWPLSFSSDGRFLAFVTVNPGTGQDIEVLPLSGGARRPLPFQQIDATESYPRFSPDGRWIAFGSEADIYVAPFPGPGRRWRVSRSGGLWPRWRRDGKELFFVAAKTLMAAEVSTEGPTFAVGELRPLFDIEPVIGGFYSYDVSADGQRILVNTVAQASESRPRSTFALNTPPWVGP